MKNSRKLWNQDSTFFLRQTAVTLAFFSGLLELIVLRQRSQGNFRDMTCGPVYRRSVCADRDISWALTRNRVFQPSLIEAH